MSQKNELSTETKHKKIKIFGGACLSSLLFLGGLYYYRYYYNSKSDNKNASDCDIKQQSTSPCGNTQQNKAENVRKQQINERYSATARNSETTEESEQKHADIAAVFGYSPAELRQIGSQANLGLGCGNPVSQANLKKGETVLDLGCGAGMDLFLAKQYIGDRKDGGQLLGVDFSKDMIAKANRNAQRKKKKKGLDISNMKFMNAEIENMKDVISDGTVDCVISNCVLNLVPNKLNAFKEVYRVLKGNGGRICLSDIALKRELPLQLKNDITSIVNCIGGAIAVKEYEQLLYTAGFKSVKFVNKNADLNVWKDSWESMVGCCDNPAANASAGADSTDSVECCGGGSEDQKQMSVEDRKSMKELLDKTDLNDYVASYYVFGLK